ncbi:hypothetical protein CYLTODRAFT_495552, partial [Cylindrobasidium torrendii FP15055 ss-10]
HLSPLPPTITFLLPSLAHCLPPLLTVYFLFAHYLLLLTISLPLAHRLESQCLWYILTQLS